MGDGSKYLSQCMFLKDVFRIRIIFEEYLEDIEMVTKFKGNTKCHHRGAAHQLITRGSRVIFNYTI